MEIKGVIFLLLGLTTAAIVECNHEGDILYMQRLAWSDPENVLQSWDPTLTNPCTWLHVTCNADNSIIRMDLGRAGLSGPLVPELGGLENLQYIELFENTITGPIPTELGNLTKLVSLDLYENQLNGTVLASLGNIKSLQFLRLNANKLTGTLPASILELVTTGSLRILNISDNYFRGTSKSSKKQVTTIVQDKKIQK